MGLVRGELGPDALILSTCEFEDGVEVTAAAEEKALEPVAAPLWAHESDLRWHGVPAPLAARLAADELVSALARELRFGDLPLGPDSKPLLFVGPPGAGKTTTTARVATRLTIARQGVNVITTDGHRAGAAEQLASFTRLLGLTLMVADDLQQLPRALARCAPLAPTLIDMPGLDPAAETDRQFLRQCLSVTGGAAVLVLPAGLDPNEAEDVAQGFASCGATLLAATRLDQSRRLGGILAAAACGLALTDAGIGPGVVDTLAAMTPVFLADRLVGAKRIERKDCPPPSALARLIQSGSRSKRPAP